MPRAVQVASVVLVTLSRLAQAQPAPVAPITGVTPDAPAASAAPVQAPVGVAPGAAPAGVASGTAPGGAMSAPPGPVAPWAAPAAERGTPPPSSTGLKAWLARDYQLALLIVDVGSASLLVGSLASDEFGTRVGAGLLGAFFTSLAGPFVHGAQGTGARGVASMGLRMGGFAAGAFIASGAFSGRDSQSRPDSRWEWIPTGFVLGGLGGMVLDHAILSTRQVPAPTTARWSPTVAPGKNGATLGLVGTW
ncbi:MAG: hypothetical protein EOO75_19700 [Myxococcales bacterium]|nr:MAG: hypothetical protein EOO75_19700 [Myxococcales bacterium]